MSNVQHDGKNTGNKKRTIRARTQDFTGNHIYFTY